MPTFTIVGRKFSPSGFADYMAHVPLEAWTPRRIVLHNTANPRLADRPNGLTEEHIENLHYYYQYRAPVGGRPIGWSGAPHLFVDQTGIWVFNPLDRRGTHSPSYNRDGWGVEMLGDYDAEAFNSGDGQRVQTNTLSALAAMFRRLDISTITDTNFKFHKEDTRTDHDCPGSNVDKVAVKTAVQALLSGAVSAVWPEVPARVVVYRIGQGQSPSAVINAVMREGTVFADVTELARATGLPVVGTGEVAVRAFTEAEYDVNWRPEFNRVYLVEK